MGALREQARIYAGALGESAVQGGQHREPQARARTGSAAAAPPDRADPQRAGQDVRARTAQLIADSRVPRGASGASAPSRCRRPWIAVRCSARSAGSTTRLLAVAAAQARRTPVMVDINPSAAGLDWQPDVKEELRLTTSDRSREMPPYIRRTKDDRLLVTVAEPVQHNRQTVGIILLTREAREVDESLFAIRRSHPRPVLARAGADGRAVLVSVARRSPRPILRLAGAAHRCARARGAPARLADLLDRGRRGGRTGGRAHRNAPRRSGRAWTRSSGSPPMSRTRSRTRSRSHPQRDRDAARASRIRRSSGGCSRSSPRTSRGSTG